MNIYVNGLTRPMTGEETEAHEASAAPSTADRIEELKARLAETDYKTLKYVEGGLDESEYLASRAQRAEWRGIINALEAGEGRA